MDRPRPKRCYRIGEISKLFGIGQDSLRYYERLGILRPRRADNGYRVYDLTDMYKLSIIKDLRRLDMPMAQIGAYLHDQSVVKTEEMLARELELIAEQVRILGERAWAIERRARALAAAQAGEIGVYAVKRYRTRQCVRLATRMERDEEMDFAIQRLYREHEAMLPDLGSMRIGAVLSGEDIAAGRTNVYESVFFILEDTDVRADFELPAGPYLSVRYRGPYEQNGPLTRKALAHAKEQGLTVVGDPIELYEIDNRDTSCEQEFVTALEIPLAPREGKAPAGADGR